MLSMAVHRGLAVDLPQSEIAELDQREVLSITLKTDAMIYVDKEPVTFEDLAQVLQDKARYGRELGALLFADRVWQCVAG